MRGRNVYEKVWCGLQSRSVASLFRVMRFCEWADFPRHIRGTKHETGYGEVWCNVQLSRFEARLRSSGNEAAPFVGASSVPDLRAFSRGVMCKRRDTYV